MKNESSKVSSFKERVSKINKPENITKQNQTILAFKSKGHRITKTRILAVEIFESIKTPISAPELLERMKEKERDVNKTTIYRELTFLQNEKFIREIDLLDGSKRYEIIKPHDHHHHLICTECKMVKCVSVPKDLDELEKKLSKTHNFKINGHVLEFFGVCCECR